MGMWLWRTCAIIISLLWNVRQTVGQIQQETTSYQAQEIPGRHHANIRCIRHPVSRCTDASVQLRRIRRNRRTRRNCRSRIQCQSECSSRQAIQIHQNPAAQPCQQNWKGRSSHRAIGTGIRRSQDHVASVRPQHASCNGRRTCQVYSLQCLSKPRTHEFASGTAWTFESAVHLSTDDTAKSQSKRNAASHQTSTSSTDDVSHSQWNWTCFLSGTSIRSNSNGRGYANADSGQWLCSTTSGDHDGSTNAKTTTTCAVCPAIAVTSSSSKHGTYAHTGFACTANVDACRANTRPTTRRLELATKGTVFTRHANARSHNTADSHDSKPTRTSVSNTSIHYERTESNHPSASPADTDLRFHIHCSATDPARYRGLTRVFANPHDSSTWTQRVANRARWGGRQRFVPCTYRSVDKVCTTATAMPTRPRCFSHASPAAAAATTEHWKHSTAATDYTSAITSTQTFYDTISIKGAECSVTSHDATTRSDSADTRKSYVHSQLSRYHDSWNHHRPVEGIFHVPSWPKTTEGAKEYPRPCPCPTCSNHKPARDRSGHFEPGTDTSPDRDCHRWRTTRCRGVGLGSCEDLIGPEDLQAVFTGTQHLCSKQSPLHSSSSSQSRVTLSLHELLCFSSQDEALHGVSHLFEVLCRPWPEDCLIRDNSFVRLLPDLAPEIRWIFKDLPIWQSDPVEEVHIYVDGSSYENRPQQQYEGAAWAFIVIVKSNVTNNEGCQFYAAVSNPLSTADMSASEFHGVGELTHDPLSSEAAGMVMVMTWIAQSPFQVKHFVHYDNCTIGRCAEGTAQWNARWEHECLHTNICAMRHCLEAANRWIQYEHVKAHEGHPMNEVADALAKATVKGIFGKMPLPVEVSHTMMNRHFRFAWMAVANSKAIPKPAALHGTFKAEGPFKPRQVDTTWWHPTYESKTSDVVVALHVATANVLTLEPGPKRMQLQGLMQSGRISMLQHQFHQEGVHIIGLQECRTQGSAVRHSATHWVFQSGATAEGARGCELWLSKQHSYTPDDSKLHCFAADHVHIAAFSDRYLLAIVRAPHVHMRVLVVHAPHQAAKDTSCEQWWQDLQRMISKIGNHLPLIVLGDMNAKLGSVQSDAVGSYGAEDENHPGSLLHAFAMESDLWIPSTFPTAHTGPSATWRSSEGQPHRLDYVLIPCKWKAFDLSSFISDSIDLCNAREDHYVVSLKISMVQSQSKTHSLKQPRIDVRKCSDPQARLRFCQKIQNPPSIDWEVGTGLHAELLTQWLQTTAQECFPRAARQPKQRYMSDFTWHVVLLRKQLRQLMIRSEKHTRLLLLKKFFVTWTHCAQHQSRYQPQVSTEADSTPSAPLILGLTKLLQRCHRSFAWALFHRQKLHSAARQSSRSDRIHTAQSIVDQFYQAAHSNDSKALYRQLRPLLGQQHRKTVHQFKPIPAVRLEDNSLAKDHDEAAQRWRSHFASAEQGILATVPQLQELAALQHPCYAHEDLPFDLRSIPSLDDIERYIHKAKAGKSPGLDGLPSELYRLAPSTMAKALWPLMAKCALRCTEPMRWRGGEVCAIPKTALANSQVEQFRSILLADFSSKICHGMLRSRLVPAIQTYRLNMQAGGIPGLGTDMLHLFVQSYMQLAKHQGVSCAALFVDIKQAFYRACRPLLVQRHVSQESLARLFLSNGWSPAMFQAFQARIAETPALAQAKISSHQIAQVNSTLSTTWFQMRTNPGTLTSTDCGTRPGDSIADLLFAFLMSRYLIALRTRFIAANLHSSFSLKWIPPAEMQPGEFDEQSIIQACWVDDVVLLLRSTTASDLVTKIQQAIAITQDLSIEFGLTLNYGPDKTAVLPAFRGPDAETVRRVVLSYDPEHPKIAFHCRSMDSAGYIDVVPSYIYLGQLQDLKGNPSAEVQRRFLVTKASSRLLRRNIFRSPRMPFRTKVMLHKTLVMSKLLYGAGAWQQMHVQTSRSWHNQWACTVAWPPQLPKDPVSIT